MIKEKIKSQSLILFQIYSKKIQINTFEYIWNSIRLWFLIFSIIIVMCLQKALSHITQILINLVWTEAITPKPLFQSS